MFFFAFLRGLRGLCESFKLEPSVKVLFGRRRRWSFDLAVAQPCAAFAIALHSLFWRVAA